MVVKLNKLKSFVHEKQNLTPQSNMAKLNFFLNKIYLFLSQKLSISGNFCQIENNVLISSKSCFEFGKITEEYINLLLSFILLQFNSFKFN